MEPTYTKSPAGLIAFLLNMGMVGTSWFPVPRFCSLVLGHDTRTCSNDLQYFWMGQTTPKNCPFHWGSRPLLSSNTWFLGPYEWTPNPKWHLDQFSRFCRAHERDWQTYAQNDDTTPSSNSPHLVQCMQCSLIIYIQVTNIGCYMLTTVLIQYDSECVTYAKNLTVN